VSQLFALSPNEYGESFIIQDVVVPMKGIIYITGCSGSGKSTLLRHIKQRWPDALVPAPPARTDIPLVDLVGDSLEESLGVLGRVGLGEAYLFLSPYEVLSEGQKARAELALALCQAPPVLIIDEFLSNLDRITAKVVALNFQKLCRRNGIVALVASCHDDLIQPLAPDCLIRLDLNGCHTQTFQPEVHPHIPELASFTLTPGTLEDYEQLSRFHYFSDHDLGPDMGRRTEVYVVRHQKKPVGVIVLASPYPQEWEYLPIFRELNELLRICMRLVVHPTYRGIGLSKMLARPAMCRTPYIEVRSALAVYQPLFLAAGYKRTTLPSNLTTPARSRLGSALSALGLHSPGTLNDWKVCERFVGRLSDVERPTVHRLALNLFVQERVMDCNYFREICGLGKLSNRVSRALWRFFREACDTMSTVELLHESAPFRMEGFAVRLNDDPQRRCPLCMSRRS